MNKFITVFTFFIISIQICAQNSTTVNDLISYQTINSIGFEWNITGDENHNAACVVRYRTQGSSSWENALDLYRVDFNGFNMLAGSILFLEASTTYEVELSLNDSDDGNSIQNQLITTRSVPRMPEGGNTYYVSPGLGGGTGSSGDPFLGIDAAQSVAQAGDIFLLSSGNYGGRIRFTESGNIHNYIVWKAAEGAVPILEGTRMAGDFIWIEGLTIQGVDYGLLTESGQENDGIVVKGNKFNDFLYGIQINHGGKNWYITDNIFVGRINDISSGEMSGEGIELQHTSGHVVSYNSISNTADGISYPHVNCDIFGNEIFNVSDDGIELDYGYANNRVWENRITNSNNNGISFQPMNSAPMYVIRNQVIVLDENVLKLRDATDRVLLAHNTLVCWSGPVSNSTRLLTSFQSNNNLWISAIDRYVWEDGSSSTSPDWRTNLDYDGFDWGTNIYAFKWRNVRYHTLEDFQIASGLETNAIQVDKNVIFENFDMPEPPGLSTIKYLQLTEGCNAIDAGVVLNNINKNFTGSAPDLGAFEYGAELPVYGPRGDIQLSENDNNILFKCNPNPFDKKSEVTYEIPYAGHVEIIVYDINGKHLRTLVNETLNSGQHQVDFYSTNLVSGVYFCKLKFGNSIYTQKIVIQK